jgi:large subunit ribosomal protein L18
MNPRKKLNTKRIRRGLRTRKAILGTEGRPRLAVRRSNRYFYAQLIDDLKGTTLVSASSFAGKKAAAKMAGTKAKAAKSADAFAVGETLGKKAIEKGIKAVVFDRSSYKFHGRVKQFAEGAKKAGLQF